MATVTPTSSSPPCAWTGVEAAWLLDSPMNGEAFLHYVREVLGPTLQPGDIVVADSLSSHKVAGVREAVVARGAQIIFLPPFSPDLNPIENFFAKLKALLRKAAKRHFDAPVGRTKIILENVTTTNASTTSSPPDTLRHESKTL